MFTKENAKRILVLVLTAMLLIAGCSVGYCESSDDIILFDPMLASIMEYSADEWFATNFDRAFLTVLIASDLALNLDNSDFDLSTALAQNNYVGLDGEDLILIFHAVDSDLYVTFRPSTGYASYAFMESASDSLVKLALDEICAGGCYVNEQEDLLLASQVLSAALEDMM